MSSVNLEYCDAFLCDDANFWMRVEHCGRYLWACDLLSKRGVTNVLDAACATGYGTDLLAARGIKALGIDCNSKYIDLANELYSCNGAQFLIADLDDDDWANGIGSFGAITCFETLEHVHYPQHLLKGLYLTLQDGGSLLLSVPNSDYEQFDDSGNNADPYHINSFNRDSVVSLLDDAGFYIEQELGQDICNRALRASSVLIDSGVTQESLDSLWSGVRSTEDMILAAKVLGYPSNCAVDRSYSFVFVCRKK